MTDPQRVADLEARVAGLSSRIENMEKRTVGFICDCGARLIALEQLVYNMDAAFRRLDRAVATALKEMRDHIEQSADDRRSGYDGWLTPEEE